MLEHLFTELPNPASEGIDALPINEILRVINTEDQKVAEAVGREIPAIAQAVEAIVRALEHGGRLFYIGAGTSGRLGVLDAAECPPTFSVDPAIISGPGRGVMGMEAARASSEPGVQLMPTVTAPSRLASATAPST